MLTEGVRDVLRATFRGLLGPAQPGTMAFVRCLPERVVHALAADAGFHLDGWQIAAVTSDHDPQGRRITAGQAVEWREDKADPALLLVDPQGAGPGMDGIYSAAREIGESELFRQAVELARQRLPHGRKGFALKALQKAGWQKRRRPLAPWSALDYLCRAWDDDAALGGALWSIGLWPVAVEGSPDDADLEHSALLVERLLPVHGSRTPPEQRVEGLSLDDDQQERAELLVQTLRRMEGAPRLDALGAIGAEPELWLNRLRPGIFDQRRLQGIDIRSWRQRNGKPYAWSGLSTTTEGDLELRLPLPDADGAGSAKLDVRWTVQPEMLPAGAASYQVTVHAGGDVLAERTLDHKGRREQKVIFSQDDFDELDEDARFQAQVRVAALGDDCEPAESEVFVLCFGEPAAGPTTSSAGRTAPSLALAAAQVADDWESFKHLGKNPQDPSLFETDKKGFVLCKHKDRVAKVFSPPLFRNLCNDWIEREGAVGRWRLRVREDGKPVGTPEFVPLAGVDASGQLARASADFAAWLSPTQGPLGVLYLVDEVKPVDRYVSAAGKLWEQADPAATLIQTLEVQSLSGACLGLIVLPTHPLRVAWQQGFDLMVAYHRYRGDNAGKLNARRLAEVLRPVNGAHYPAFLPGLTPEQTFVFGDTLGLHAVAMVTADDPEPKATLALLGRLLGGDEATAPSVGEGAADALAGELGRYLQLHPLYRRIRVHALRAGDARPVARALGRAQNLATDAADGDDSEDLHSFELELFPGSGRSTAQSGRFLAATAERRRSGAGAVPEEDRWLLQSVTRPGGVTLPRLRWARRDAHKPDTPAHVAIAFDVFTSRVETRPAAELPPDGTLEAHGLMLVPSRDFHAGGTPHWLSFVPVNPKGDQHPFTSKLTRRQVGLHALILRATARHLGGREDAWPVLVTEVSPDQAHLLEDLHGLCDWVMTADRNAGIEYFDSPRALPAVYDAYIIDCVPERDDLGFMQLITSTSSFEEVRGLLDGALAEMGLSASPGNCAFLLDALKAVSGRLALRLAGEGTTTQQMIAIALVQHHCRIAPPADPVWPSLASGFLVPVDDVPELFRPPENGKATGSERADLLYVAPSGRNGLSLAFIEVKFRRYLKTARAPDLADAMDRQLEASCKHWQQLFGAGVSSLEQTVNRAWLARVLRFYARKARRHGLDDDVFSRLMHAIDAMVRRDTDLPDRADIARVGFVFCPEYAAAKPDRIDQIGHADLWLFGAGILPEPGGGVSPQGPPAAEPSLGGNVGAAERFAAEPDVEASPGGDDGPVPPATLDAAASDSGSEARVRTDAEEPRDVATAEPADPPSAADNPEAASGVLLGHRESGETPLLWHADIRANPHLMILGLPGMGKTTSLINICVQLVCRGITPIVFSYHQDIDEKLAECLAEPPLTVRYAGLGFNPMQVVGDGAVGYLDNAGMIRDIFAAIFPDLGDVQLGRLREALKRSYLDLGWAPGQRGELPEFRAFLDLLRNDAKPDKGLLTRLDELDDYGLFGAGTGAPTLLDRAQPALIEIHGTQNDHLQRAFATFVLYNLYQSMFRRGPQQRITHAVIFDEAHKAARLKLLASMVKECRKYGLAFVVASQEAKDFDPSLFTAIANYLALRLNEADAKLLAKSFAATDRVKLVADRIKQMPKYKAMYYGEGLQAPTRVSLLAEPPGC